jgi:hypothetical protein
MQPRSLALDAGGHPHIAYGGDALYHAWHDGDADRHAHADGDPGDAHLSAVGARMI